MHPSHFSDAFKKIIYFVQLVQSSDPVLQFVAVQKYMRIFAFLMWLCGAVSTVQDLYNPWDAHFL